MSTIPEQQCYKGKFHVTINPSTILHYNQVMSKMRFHYHYSLSHGILSLIIGGGGDQRGKMRKKKRSRLVKYFSETGPRDRTMIKA